MGKVTIDWEENENVEWHDYRPQASAGGAQERRKLLITTDNFLPRWDGISRFLSEIVPRLKESYDITIVAPDYGPVHIDGVAIERIPLAARSYGGYTPAKKAYSRVRALVRGTDIVFNQALGPIGVSAIIAAKRCRRPVVNYIHSVEWELFPKAIASPALRGPLVTLSKALARVLYNRCAALIVPSEGVAEQFSWQGIRTRKRVVHLGVDTRKFSPGDRKAARARLGIPHDAFVVGYHGRISHEKNLVTLLRGFSRARIPRKQLYIVGDGVPELRERIGRQQGVTVAGSTDNVVEWLRAMDAYVQPSFTETTSLSVLEAMACRLPVVSSKVGFIKHYIVDGKNGLFFDNTSGYDLARKLTMLHDDAALRERLAASARETIQKDFNWDTTAEQIKRVLDEFAA